jgi:hypothetical protein
MRFEKLIVVALALTGTTARAQSSREADAIKALEHVENAKSDSIPPEVRAAIINKPKIAEATLQRAIGLREAGNPHIQRGTGLFLPDMKDDPSISRVDLNKLHEERVAMIEHRSARASVHASSSAVHGSETPAPGAASQAAPEREQSYAGLLFAGASLLLTGAGAVYFWKSQKK